MSYEHDLYEQGFRRLAGLDEAGRGAWAGPVTAAVVILPLDRPDLACVLEGVNDSKKLTPRRREALLPAILEVALAAAVGHATNAEIDELGIVPATHLAMTRALAQLSSPPDHLIIDSLGLPQVALPQLRLVRGDQKSLSIAAASILAKVTRDRHMVALDEDYPGYGFGQHKGYGTRAHQAMLTAYGPCPKHRMSFRPVRERLQSQSVGVKLV
jgi:ribonuclease HII